VRAQDSDEALRNIRLCESRPGSLAAEAHFVAADMASSP
jgi:hypothetical protein